MELCSAVEVSEMIGRVSLIPVPDDSTELVSEVVPTSDVTVKLYRDEGSVALDSNTEVSEMMGRVSLIPVPDDAVELKSEMVDVGPVVVEFP